MFSLGFSVCRVIRRLDVLYREYEQLVWLCGERAKVDVKNLSSQRLGMGAMGCVLYELRC